jgi:hypothetical protein
MTYVGFEPTIPASERGKTVHALDRSPTVTGLKTTYSYFSENEEFYQQTNEMAINSILSSNNQHTRTTEQTGLDLHSVGAWFRSRPGHRTS